MDPKELYAKARAALDRKADPEEVNAIIRRETGGRAHNMESLRALASQKAPPEDPEEAALLRLNASGGNALSDFTTMLGHGLTFGFDDDIIKLLAGRKNGEAYQQKIEDLRSTSPGASLASEVAGGILLPGFGGGALAARMGARGARIRAAAGAGALTGAAGGALYGAGDVNEDRGGGALVGGGAGLVGGGLLGGAAAVGGRAVERWISPLVRKVSRGLLGRKSELPGLTDQKVLQTLLRDAGREDLLLDPSMIPGEVQAIGPEAVTADISPNLASMSRKAVNKASSLEARGGPVERIRVRGENMPRRVADYAREASGITDEVEDVLRVARTGIDDVRDQFYKPLEGTWDQVDAPRTLDILSDTELRDHVKNHTGDFLSDLRAYHRQFAFVARQVGPQKAAEMLAETGVTKPRPTFRQMQDVRRALSQEARQEGPRMSVADKDRAKRLLNTLDEALSHELPTFREANALYADFMQRMDALEQGAKMWRGGDHPREILAVMDRLKNEEQRQAFRLGMLDEMEKKLGEKIGKNAEGQHAVRAGDTHLERLRLLSKDDTKYRKLLDDIERERVYARTEGEVLDNSSTAKQLEQGLNVPMLGFSPKLLLAKEFLRGIKGFSDEEFLKANEMLGKVLLTDGEEAATLLATRLAGLAATAGRLGGMGGTAASTSTVDLFNKGR